MTSAMPARGKRAPFPHVGVNAQLLALDRGYRSAGISNYIYQLLRHLPRVSDFRYTVWMEERAGDLSGIERRITPLPTHRPAVRILWEQLLQPYAVWRARPDLLHGMAYALPLWLPLPAVVTIHDLAFLHVPEVFRPLNRLYLTVMTRLSARRASHICAVAEHGRQDIVDTLGISPGKISVVYNGLNPEFKQVPAQQDISTFRSRKGLPDRFVLYLGTLEPRKNVPAILRAFASARKQVPGVKLVLAGGKGWGYEAIFRESERLGLKNEVIFPGFVPEEEKRFWYAAAELFVYPSSYEGFGLPPLEAMASGTPVITSNATSLVEVVGEAGITIDPAEEEELAEAITALLTDCEERERRRALGLQQATRFDWADSARAQASVYQRVLEGRA